MSKRSKSKIQKTKQKSIERRKVRKRKKLSRSPSAPKEGDSEMVKAFDKSAFAPPNNMNVSNKNKTVLKYDGFNREAWGPKNES